MPPKLSFAQGAGLAIVYLTAYEGLIQLAKIKPRDKVLIHAGTGGVGLAAIQLAQIYWCGNLCNCESIKTSIFAFYRYSAYL